MSIDPNDEPAEPRRDVTPDAAFPSAPGAGQDATTYSEGVGTPILATSPGAATDPVTEEVRLPGDVTPAAPDESAVAAIDRAGGPDKVAIAMMVGVVVLVLICVAFAFAAR